MHAEEIKNAELVANPGCYPTGAILAVAPLVRARKVKCVVFDAKSGISGGGVEPSQRSHFPNLAENIIPYEVTTHRHTAEIRKELKVSVHFTPHVIPAIRGILTTAHVFLRESMSEDEIYEIYRQFYEGKKFIRILNEVPSLQNVRGTNFCDIWFEVERGASVGEVSDVGEGGEVGSRADKVEEVKEVGEVEESSRVVVISAIDNLVKGGAGQAIQNMNVMFNLREETGLWFPALVP
ncbi:MAG: N-acetyl-gamma-glutamylphosphate reductase [Methanophagales archaeon]|nr:N-acetyl-gamma-glutamylphosphate reductase [Methanophagales archaeon]